MKDLGKFHDDDLEEMDLKWNMALLSMRARKFYQRTGRKIIIDGSSTAGYDKSKVECFNCHKMGHFARECRAPRSKDNINWNQGSSSKAVRIEDASEKAMCAIDGAGFDWSDMAEYDDLLVKLDDTGFKASTYKRERENEGFEFKIAKFEKSSKDLDDLLASQITDKSKKGFGYNVVPSPYPLILNRPTPLDLSYSGLEEFKQPEVNEYGPRDSSVKPTTGCDKESDNSKENTDDSLKQQQKTDSSSGEDLKKARENMMLQSLKIGCWMDGMMLSLFHQVEKKTVFTYCYKKEFVKPEKNSLEVVGCPNVHIHLVPKGACLNVDGLETVIMLVDDSRPCLENISPYFQIFLDLMEVLLLFDGCSIWRLNYCIGLLKTDKLDFDDVYFVKELKFNLFSVSQMCDKKNYVLFTDSECLVLSPNFKLPDENQILLKIPRQDNMYSFDMKNIVPKDGLTCLVAKATSEESMLWHRRLGHVNFKNINKLVKENLDETSEILKNFIKEIENLVDKKVKIIRSDNGTEFKNKVMDEFCREKGIKREYSVARTPQQNGVAERKNRTLIEAARTMLADSKLPTTFWAEAVSTACYVQNRVLIVKPHNKTPYELFRGIKPAIGFMKPFGCHVTILNTLDKLGKFDGKSDEENKPMIEGNGPKWLFDLDSLTQSMNYVPVVAGKSSNDFAGIQGVSESSTSSQQDQANQDCIVMPIWKDASYFDDASPRSVADAHIQDKDELHDEDDATEESHDGSSLQNNGTADQQVNTARPEVNTGSREVSTALPEVNTATPEDLVGPSPASEDSHVEDQEIELGNIPQSYEVPTTPHTRIHKDHPIEHVIGDVQSSVQTRRMKTSYSEKGFLSAIYEGKTHQDLHTCLFVCFLSQEEPKRVSQALKIRWWVYRNKKDERGIVIRNKVRLVAQGHTQEEDIDYDEVFAPVARIEAIRIFLAYASYIGFMVYQWISKVISCMVHNGDILACSNLVEDIFFGSTKKELCDEFEKLMKDKFQMSSMGELTFFLGLQVQQKRKGIFISQDKYVHEILRKFNYSYGKSASTSTDLEKPLVQDGDAADVDEHLYRSMIGSLMYLTASRPDIMFAVCACARYSKDSSLELVAYTDSDYAGATLDRKSTTEDCQFLGNRLISWQCKKQTVVATSTTEAEYVAAASCCGQVLWIQNQLLDYGYNFMDTVIYIDNTSTICIIENPVQHSKTKHIEIRHHFIRDCNAKKLIQMAKIDTQHNVADLLTKGFDAGRFQYLVSSIGMLNP
ncbi:putative ribonuclease H-like domain-containing protein [Tanacetum coccineum]